MRSMGWAIVAALAVVPLVTAQAPSPVLADIRLKLADAPVDPGATTAFHLEAARLCPNAADVLDPQDLDVVVSGANVTVKLKGHFEQQVCASQSKQTQAVDGVLAIPANAPRGAMLSMKVTLSSPQAGPTTPAMPREEVPFTLQTTPVPAGMTTSAPTQESPALPMGALALALALAAFAAMRRRP